MQVDGLQPGHFSVTSTAWRTRPGSLSSAAMAGGPLVHPHVRPSGGCPPCAAVHKESLLIKNAFLLLSEIHFGLSFTKDG